MSRGEAAAGAYEACSRWYGTSISGLNPGVSLPPFLLVLTATEMRGGTDDLPLFLWTKRGRISIFQSAVVLSAKVRSSRMPLHV